MYTLDAIMDIFKQNEFPNNQDIYGWNAFAIEKKWFPWWYQWRRYQLERLGLDVWDFEKQSLQPGDLAECRLGWFEWLLKYYKEYLTDDNFLTCEQAKIKYAIKAANLQNNSTLEAIKQAIRSGELTELNIIWFEKQWVRIIHDGTQRALAVTQMLSDGEMIPVKVHRYVQVLDDSKSYPYIDYYPQEK